VVQVGQRIELSEQGKEYDKRFWGMLSKGGQGTVTQVPNISLALFLFQHRCGVTRVARAVSRGIKRRVLFS